MSTTLIKEINQKPLSLYNDATYVYVAMDGGRVDRIVIDGGTQTVFKIFNDKVNAITKAEEEANLYIGLASGELKQVVINTGVVSTLEIFDSAIISLAMFGASMYIGLANGQIRFRDFTA